MEQTPVVQSRANSKNYGAPVLEIFWQKTAKKESFWYFQKKETLKKNLLVILWCGAENTAENFHAVENRAEHTPELFFMPGA